MFRHQVHNYVQQLLVTSQSDRAGKQFKTMVKKVLKGQSFENVVAFRKAVLKDSSWRV